MHAGLIAAASGKLLDRPLAQLLGCLIPRQRRDPSHLRLLQLHRIGQGRRALVEYQSDRVPRDLISIQHAQHACQRDREFFHIRYVAGVDVVTQTQAMLAIQHVAESHLTQIVPALLIVAALRQMVLRVGAGDVGVEVGGVVAQQAAADQLLLLP